MWDPALLHGQGLLEGVLLLSSPGELGLPWGWGQGGFYTPELLLPLLGGGG